MDCDHADRVIVRAIRRKSPRHQPPILVCRRCQKARPEHQAGGLASRWLPWLKDEPLPRGAAMELLVDPDHPRSLPTHPARWT